jgi:ribosomal subunit interface protein
MINKLEIVSVHADLDKNIERYVNKKIGQLDRFIPRNSRESVHVTVWLKDKNSKDKNNCTCEIVMRLPHEIIEVHESTINMYAAVDIVEAKLRQQLTKYKELHNDPKFYRRVFSRLSKKTNVV